MHCAVSQRASANTNKAENESPGENKRNVNLAFRPHTSINGMYSPRIFSSRPYITFLLAFLSSIAMYVRTLFDIYIFFFDIRHIGLAPHI